MKVKILPAVADVKDGVSRYTVSLVNALRNHKTGQTCFMIVDGDDYDILHLLAAHRYAPEWREAKRRGRRLVVTVHDLIPEHFGLTGPQYSGVAERREILEAADAIIAVSQYTKDDIVATYAIPSSKIHVVHNGVEQQMGLSSVDHLRLQPSPYILWVGRRAGYKNFFWFVRAVAPLLWKTGWHVVCTGGQPFGRKERLLVALLGLSRRFTVVRADEATMAQLYREAVCLVMPSRMEGFGLPVIEAMANGCPAVIPRAHVFPEIAGDAALYFRAWSGRDLRRAIRASATADCRENLLPRGFARAKSFSWSKCAADVVALYL